MWAISDNSQTAPYSIFLVDHVLLLPATEDASFGTVLHKQQKTTLLWELDRMGHAVRVYVIWTTRENEGNLHWQFLYGHLSAVCVNINVKTNIIDDISIYRSFCLIHDVDNRIITGLIGKQKKLLVNESFSMAVRS